MIRAGFDEEQIISACKKNDRRSQELLYRHFAKKMYALCLGYAVDRPMAQDILQESFIKVFKNISQFKNEGSLEGWIRRIVTNTAIDHIRKNKRTNEFIETEPDDPGLFIENSVVRLMGFNELLEKIESLPEGARLIFNMHAIDGYTHKEIAGQLNITEGTSKSQFNRARKLLMNQISG